MKRSSLLQVVALVAMTVDHVGYLFFPESVFYRIIGRVAFPVFAYGIAEGYKVTRDVRKYFIRLIVLAVISQIPYMYAFNVSNPNVIITLLSGLVSMVLIDNKKYLYVLAVLGVCALGGFDYGLYGLSMILVFNYLREDKLSCCLFNTLLTLFYIGQTGNYVQIFALPVFFAIAYLPELKERVKFPRRVFYIYYPLHLAVLAVMVRLVS